MNPKYRVTWTSDGIRHRKDHDDAEAAGTHFRQLRARKRNSDVGVECVGVRAQYGEQKRVDKCMQALEARDVTLEQSRSQWRQSDVFDLGEYHACLTGDCDHDSQSLCMKAIEEFIGELCKAGKALQEALANDVPHVEWNTNAKEVVEDMLQHVSSPLGPVRFDPTNHHNARLCPYCTPQADREFVLKCYRSVQYGCPGLSIDEQQRLVEIASGMEVEKRKRCKRCHGEGEVPELDYETSRPCPGCNGTGWEVSP